MSEPKTAAATSEPSSEPPLATPDLFQECQTGDVSAIESRVSQDGLPSVLTSRDSAGATALHWSSLRGHLDLVQYLLSRGADRDSLTTDGQTPAHWAAIGGHPRVIHALGGGPADAVQFCDKSGCNCLHHAAQNDRKTVGLYCLGSGVNVDSRDAEGHTALQWSAYTDHEEFVIFLLAQGAAVDVPDASGRTALHWAAARGNYTCAKRLLKAGANPALRTDQGETAEDLATRKNNAATAALLRNAARQPMDAAHTRRYFLAWGAVGALWLPLFCLLCAYVPVAVVVVLLMLTLAWARRRFGETFPKQDSPTLLWVCWFYALWGVSGSVYLFRIMPTWPESPVYHLVFIVLGASLLGLFTAVVRSEPGTVPRGTLGFAELQRMLDVPAPSDKREDPVIQLEDHLCVTCLAYKPVRSKHCAACDRCVARFDHHCVWVNNCIGVGNHKMFLALLFNALVVQVMLIIGLIVLFHNSPSLPSFSPVLPYIYHAWCEHHVAVICLLLHCGMIGWEVYLTGGQVWLAANNLTTNETINWTRYNFMHDPVFGGFHNPFDQGSAWSNLSDFFVGRVDWLTARLSTFVHTGQTEAAAVFAKAAGSLFGAQAQQSQV